MHEGTPEFTARDFGTGSPRVVLPPVFGHDITRWRLPMLDDGEGVGDREGDESKVGADAPACDARHDASAAAQAATGGAGQPGAAAAHAHPHAHAAGDARAHEAAHAHDDAHAAEAIAARAREAQLGERIAELEAELQALRDDVAAVREAAAAEGRAAGFDEGRVAGQATVEKEAAAQRAKIAAAWAAVEAKVEARLGALDDRLGDAVHELVLALGHTVLRTELSISGAPLHRLIDDVLGGLREELAGAVVVLHPDDLALLEQAAGERVIATRADPDMQRGDLLIRSPGGDIEASLRARVEAAMVRLTGEEA